MVEVGQDDLETLVLLTESVLVRNKDVVEGDICSSRSRRVRSLDYLGLNTFLTLDQQDKQASLFSACTDSEIVGERSVGDPLFAVQKVNKDRNKVG